MIRTTGRTESHIDELARPIYEPLAARQPPVRTTILASLGQIDLHLSTVGADPRRAGAFSRRPWRSWPACWELRREHDGRSLPEVVGELLRRRRARVAVAESCTGGLIASRLTDVPGSSAYVHAGWVLYSNEAKVALGVAPALIEADGAVSEPVAEAMAVAARAAAGVDFGLAVTGIAGPGGATPESRSARCAWRSPGAGAAAGPARPASRRPRAGEVPGVAGRARSPPPGVAACGGDRLVVRLFFAIDHRAVLGGSA